MSLCGLKKSTKPLRLLKRRWSAPTLIYPNRPTYVQMPVAEVWDSSYNRKLETHGPSSKPAQDSDAETRYAIELELLAVTWTITKCHLFLAGLPYFTVITDHAPSSGANSEQPQVG